MHYSPSRAARLTIATALTGTTLATLAITALAPTATAATQQARSDSRINIASISVRSLALTLSPKPGTAVLSWASPRTRTKFTVLAAPVKRPSATRMLKATNSALASFTGLDENARYVFTVTPQVGTFTGPTSRLLMTATLKQLRSLSVAGHVQTISAPASTTSSNASAVTLTANAATTSAATTAAANAPSPAQQQAAPQSAPQPAAAPAAPATPRTRTVYVCPDGFTEVSGTCTTTLPYTYSTLAYTYSTLAYTYHQEPYTVTVQDPGITYAADTARSQGTLCPWGGSPNANGDLCSIAGGTHQETRYNTVKDTTPSGYTDTGSEWKKRDATPAGYTDTGSEWKKKDAAPAGFTDDGTQWVKTTAKIATEVPA